ncbi:cellulose synthase/poly-beta-1,6-N-acetylglucosamine synthase-like glycosyltransferase [Actinomadura pelletieri DSM 43383]|uniref:Cellulose synthase/poly-beta-1,6-N-acetylglucosamine synthase-like glycosyltransferase n=1 Tax=Actinomadura pelletieri DSM 43383 TaxID=1120940 RepID=A0A495QS41_9ACTN|nr:glycosyltransferase family 2 protein [Actinomadura pelletieri]RKS76330.1 cellulose synthase/poly-beta-1,6-N-acetylglucosamine synthase-like glycosyltransferase [Actinomadura pelletieri DSM 43383]
MNSSPHAQSVPQQEVQQAVKPRSDSGERTWPAVSVVMPVLNEERHLAEAVRGILTQDYPGELELVLAVGPCRDRTEKIARALAADDQRVLVVANPTGRTPQGLNIAIKASQYSIVVRVDGHSLLPSDYVRAAVETMEETGADNVGGIMAAEGVTPFEKAVARAMTSKIGVGNARFHTGGEPGEVETVYLGTFRRSALERVGGYDETFARAQDWEMNHRIRQTGGRVFFTPRMRVTYRPRPNLRALAKQYFHTGRWRRVVGREHQGTLNFRYLAPPIAVVAMTVGAVAGVFGFWPGWLVPGGYAAALIVGAAVEGRGLPLTAWLRLPLVYATMHVTWGVGFLTSPPRLGQPSPVKPGESIQ